MLKTDNLNVGYNKKSIIKDISLDIKNGEIISLIGPNGAGKSTTLKTIAKHIDKIEGSIYISGKNADEYDDKEYSKLTSVLLTDKVKTELLTCFDIVAAGRYPYTGKMGFLRNEDKKIIEDSMAICRINELADKDFNKLSDGQKQRVLLCRAIAQSPKLLILDEPTAFLDIKYKAMFINIIKNLSRQNNITIIMSLHEIEFAKKISDKIVALKGDRVFAYGEPEDVCRKEIIKELYEIDDEEYKIMFE